MIINLKRVLTILAVTAISFIAVTAASAQDGMGQKLKNATPQQRAQYQTGLMKSKLQLDTAQILKVKAVNLKYAQLFEPIIKSDDSRFTRLKKAKDLQEQKDKELKGIFTKDQFKKYQDFESEMKSKMMSKANM